MRESYCAVTEKLLGSTVRPLLTDTARLWSMSTIKSTPTY